MKIDFSRINSSETERTVTGKTTEYAAPKKIRVSAGGIHADISGMVKDNTAYGPLKTNKGRGSQGKTLAEGLQELDSYDAKTAHNYMAVMSHSMSARDFHELMEEGYHLSLIHI